MGITINRRDFPSVIKHAQQGLFLLTYNVSIPVVSSFLNIGLILVERMYRAKVDGIPADILSELNAILNEEQSNITLENIDILFSPKYELNVIKLLLLVGRNKRLFVHWPGEFTGEKLTYSEPGRYDFKEYNVKDYVDTYVVLR